MRPDPPGELLVGPGGAALARLQVPADDAAGDVHVEPLPGPAVAGIAAQVLLDLQSRSVQMSSEALAQALVAAGARLERAASLLRHDLTDLPARPALAPGWSLAAAGWDADLADALARAYGSGHVDGAWSAEDTTEVQGMFEAGAEVPALGAASARVAGPDGRSAGHVLCAGPVPWADEPCSWVLNLGVAPHAQARGLGRALLAHALHGSRTAGLPALLLQVTDGNPARRLYDAAGLTVLRRVLTVRVPGQV